MTLPVVDAPTRTPLDHNRLSTAAWSMFGVVVALVILGILVVDRNFWFDEGMAYQAIVKQGFLAPGQPLLNYEQSMPYGVYALYKLLTGAVGLNEDVLRVPGLVVYAAGLVALARATRQIEGTAGRLAAMASGGLAMWVVFEAGMFKHYIFEYAAGALILSAGYSLLHSRLQMRSLVVFAAVSVISLLFSNTAPFMTGAVLLAVVVVFLVEDRPLLYRRLISVVVAAVLYLLVFGFLYVVVITPSNVYQLALPFYTGSGLGSLGHALSSLWAPTGKPAFELLGVVIFVVIAVGLVLTVRRGARALFPYVLLLLLVAAMAVGAKTGLSPFSNPRHVLFSVPAIGLAFGAATQAILDVLARPLGRRMALRVVSAAVIVVVGLAFAGIGLFGATKKQEEVGRILAANEAGCATTYVEYTYQPAAEMYVARDRLKIQLEGLVDSRSGLGHRSWLSKVTDDLPAYEAKADTFFRSNGPACLLARPVRAQDDLLKALSASGIDCAVVDKKTGIGLYRCTA